MKLTLIILSLVYSLPIFADLDQWQGDWQGECLTQNLQQKVLRYKTRLTIQPVAAPVAQGPVNAYKWHLHYQGQAVRPYTLKVKTDNSPEFLLDEHNGILLHQTLFPANRTFTSLFSVNDLYLQASYQLLAGEKSRRELELSINTFESTSPMITSSAGNNVQSFKPLASQNCRFKLLTENFGR